MMDTKRHLCLVDDDRDIRTLLSEYLTRNGFRVAAFADGPGLRRFLARGITDLVVLDVMLPGEDGLSICRTLRAETDVPIVMLSARVEDVDRIVGLELGADDYICKPFNPRELLARITNLLRRSDQRLRESLPESLTAFRFAGWKLDIKEQRLLAEDGTEVELSGGEFRLLALLLLHANRILARGQLFAMLRGRELDSHDRSIDVQISRLRQLLGDNAREARIIKTVYGAGYVIGVAVTRS